MEVYALFREGVYRHQCGGIFTKKELASKALKELEEAEPDDYHDWQVVPFELDKLTELVKLRPDQEPQYDWHEFKIIERPAITEEIRNESM